MAASKRKRFSAFEDFPGNDETPGQPQEPTAVSFIAKTAPPPAAQVERIERLKPSQILPDRFQPRRLLPGSIRHAFFNGEIDCYQAAAEWLHLARQDAGHRAQIDNLLAMGNSFEAHGQIKPITGSWITDPQGQYWFQIETGERRFWAACLQAVSAGAEEEPLLRVEVIQQPSRQRQVLENRHAEAPSAVSQACEIAALILSELGAPPAHNTPDEYEYFRAARAQRMPAGLWDRLMPIMQLTRPRMVQFLNILQLPSHLLDLADRYRLPERVLREVLTLTPDKWEEAIRLSIQNEMTSDQVAELATKTVDSHPERSSPPASAHRPEKTAVGGLRRFANALINLDRLAQAQTLDTVADELVTSDQADEMVTLLEELTNLLQARLKRR
jgi:hypothetical protein